MHLRDHRYRSSTASKPSPCESCLSPCDLITSPYDLGTPLWVQPISTWVKFIPICLSQHELSSSP
jgi:hypothetical protein